MLLIGMIEDGPFFADEDDIFFESGDIFSREIVNQPSKGVPIHTSWCLLSREYDPDASIGESI